ncbi:MAG: 50S ribosomal protein L29 [Leptospiraceae bacterium]|nr:50S ribosomal protein L29 [Leptospiraceae bacterium]
MSDEELRSMARQFKKELQQLRFQLVTGTVPNTARITHLKRDVARIYTVLRQRELGISAKSKSGK